MCNKRGGCRSAYGGEEIVRDLRVHQNLEGTNQIMRVTVVRRLMQDPR
ncbi:hypothetical protein [Streptomyces cirratus]